MSAISSTRIELLTRKSQIKLAKQGHSLLEQKRAALMAELLKVANEVLQEADILDQATTSTAYQSLARANAVAGTEAVKSAALAAYRKLTLNIHSTNVIGVKVPVIEQRDISQSTLERGYSIIGTSITIDEAASDFEFAVTTIIQLARSELRLRRLVDEIRKTARRLNALERILIPRLEAEHDYIQMTLDERERSDYFRLKLAKRALERKK